MIKSPCIKICKLENGHCVGCFRTIDEITQWKHLTDEERDVILHEVEKRKHGTVVRVV